MPRDISDTREHACGRSRASADGRGDARRRVVGMPGRSLWAFADLYYASAADPHRHLSRAPCWGEPPNVVRATVAARRQEQSRRDLETADERRHREWGRAGGERLRVNSKQLSVISSQPLS